MSVAVVVVSVGGSSTKFVKVVCGGCNQEKMR